MMKFELSAIVQSFKGKFLIDPILIQSKLLKAKAFVFDWDGVFNNGLKDENGSSPFSEIDAMGTNLLRFNYFLLNGQPPIIALMSGEQNKASFTLARREHFNAVYYKVRNKPEALSHFCKSHNILPEEVAFVFDDVLDLGMASLCGLRIMVSRLANPLLMSFITENNLAEYITHADGANHAVRESVEMLTGLSGLYNQTIEGRMKFSDEYQHYLKLRNIPETMTFTSKGPLIIEQQPT